MDHEMTLNQGRTVWDGKTALSYSPDSRKTLTLASSLTDVSDVYRSVQQQRNSALMQDTNRSLL